MLNTQSIAKAAAAALGGEPVKPPAMPTQTIGKAAPIPTGDADARAAFKARHEEPISPITGNPTFDAPDPAVIARREKVASVRTRLGALIRQIESEHTALMPALAEFDADAAELQAAEQFDPATARKFLAYLHATVESLTRKAAKPAKEKAEAKA